MMRHAELRIQPTPTRGGVRRRCTGVLLFLLASSFLLAPGIQGQAAPAPGRAAPDSTAREPTGPVPAESQASAPERGEPDTFVDPGAERLFGAARRHWLEAEGTIASYRALRRERVAAVLRTPLKDRTLFHAESASRVLWDADSTVVVQLLASSVTGPAGQEPPGELFGIEGVFDPDGDRLVFGLGERRAGDDEGVSVGVSIRHPIAPGSEAFYRYALGDTLTLTLPDGRRLTAVGLEVIPRERSGRLLSGLLWIEPEGGALVRALYRLSTPRDLEAEGSDGGGLPWWVPGIFRPVQIDLSMVVLDYALWEFEHWLPRRVRAEGWARAGAIRVPMTYEQTYRVLDVVGRDDAEPAEEAAEVARRWLEEGDYGAYRVVEESRPGESGDAAAAVADSGGAGARPDGATGGAGDGEGRGDGGRAAEESIRARIVLAPVDSTRLHDPELLPPPIGTGAPGFADPSEIAELREILQGVPLPRTSAARPVFSWGPERADLLRYNRVEGLSVGGRLEWPASTPFGPVGLTTTARVGLADRVPSGALTLSIPPDGPGLSLSAFHRIEPVDPEARSLGLGASLTALFLGRDDGDYFRATGASLSWTPASADGRPWLSVTLAAEGHEPLPVVTDFALPGLLGGDRHPFRTALAAEPLREYSATLSAAPFWGSDPGGVQGGLEAWVQAAEGDRRWVRSRLVGRAAVPLVLGLRAGAEVAGGHTWGDAPLQRSWFLGGTRTLRGYPGGAAVGPTFGRVRFELGGNAGAARMTLFGDGGWAGEHGRWDPDDALWSAGVGASFLDGVLRIDLARALRRPTGWSLSIHLDSML